MSNAKFSVRRVYEKTSARILGNKFLVSFFSNQCQTLSTAWTTLTITLEHISETFQLCQWNSVLVEVWLLNRCESINSFLPVICIITFERTLLKTLDLLAVRLLVDTMRCMVIYLLRGSQLFRPLIIDGRRFNRKESQMKRGNLTIYFPFNCFNKHL